MTISEVVALAGVIISIGANVGIYIHLTSVMNNRFDSVEQRLELLAGGLHEIDNRLVKL